MEKDCIFCKIISGEIKVDPVFENEKVLAFRDVNPQAPVHMLVITKEHISTVEDMYGRPDVIADVYDAIGEVVHKTGISENGYRVIVNCGKDGGQEVFHLHFHVLGGRKMTWPPG